MPNINRLIVKIENSKVSYCRFSKNAFFEYKSIYSQVLKILANFCDFKQTLIINLS